MRLWWQAALVVAAISGSACYPLNNVCGHHDEPLTADGGADIPCTRGEECPRTSHDVVCADNGLDEANCVACQDLKCVRKVAELCR